MGQVYLVEHVELGHFALKILREEFACDAEFVDRMRLEAQAIATSKRKRPRSTSRSSIAAWLRRASLAKRSWRRRVTSTIRN
jgi:hypothetical protein